MCTKDEVTNKHVCLTCVFYYIIHKGQSCFKTLRAAISTRRQLQWSCPSFLVFLSLYLQWPRVSIRENKIAYLFFFIFQMPTIHVHVVHETNNLIVGILTDTCTTCWNTHWHMYTLLEWSVGRMKIHNF